MVTTLRPVDPEDTGFDLVVIAGQSNAVGQDATTDANLDVPDPRIWQYAASGTYLGTISRASDPLGQNSIVGVGPGMEFARRYALSVPTNRRVLLVPAARGGVPFEGVGGGSFGVGYTWKVGRHDVTNLYDAAVTQASNALTAAGSNARVVAIVWVHGENDAVNGTTGATYQTDIDALIDGMRAAIPTAANALFLIGQMNPDYLTNNATRPDINAVHIDTPRRKLLSGFAYGTTGLNLGDGFHYNAAGARALGAALHGAYRLARGNVLGTAPVAPGAITFVQSGTTVVATWARKPGRVTDYKVETNTGSGWSQLTRAQSIDKTATITGLTLGATLQVRVSAINEQGTSAPGAVATFTVATAPGQVAGLTAGTSTVSSVPLTWTAVTGATSYQVQYKATSSGTWLTGPLVTATAAAVTGLNPNTSYDFRVAAINAAGTGTNSATTTASTLTVPVLIFDNTIPAFRAVGLRQLVTNYTGPLIRVRRSTDNTEQDIGQASAALDTTALLAFVGSGDGYVSKWYDQSGNARDFVQATTSAQPKIATAGAVNTVGGKPAVLFVRANSNIMTSSAVGLYAAGASSAFSVYSLTTRVNLESLGAEGSTTAGKSCNYGAIFPVTAGHLRTNAFDDSAGAIYDLNPATLLMPTGALSQKSFVDTGTSVGAWQDAAVAAAATTYTRSGHTVSALNISTMGATYVAGSVGTSYLDGAVSEWIQVASAVTTTQRQAAEAYQKAYWATP